MRSAARLALVAAAILAVLVPTAPAGAASSCGQRQLSRPFLPWLDPAQYFLMPGGDLESSAGWTLAGGGQVVVGNEPFAAHAVSDSHALRLPSGASARTPVTCADFDEPTLRFFVRNQGSVLSTLAVTARIRTTVLGLTLQTTVPVGVVPGTSQSWQPSLPAVFFLSANQILGGTTTVDFTFVPVGPAGDWYVDDVYVDPFKDRGQS